MYWLFCKLILSRKQLVEDIAALLGRELIFANAIAVELSSVLVSRALFRVG